ncbi:MAG: glycoside hydrolase family 18 protein [bacterium]
MANPMLVLYWLKDGGSGKFPVPPLDSVANYPPLANVVNLFAANLAVMSDGTIGVEVPAEIEAVLGQAKQLQSQGASVVLSVMNGSNGLGWSTLTAAQNQQLASSISSLISQTDLDGIDIDDENVGGTPANFYATVSAIRSALPGIFISNAIYDYEDYEKFSQYPDLIDLMTLCSTMVYGDSYDNIISNVQWFNEAGIPMDKLCAGVQAGPAGTSCDNGAFTSIATSKQVAQWAKTNCAGVMLFTFSQDIVSFTGCPQHGPYPDPNDHAWQIAIQGVLFG